MTSSSFLHSSDTENLSRGESATRGEVIGDAAAGGESPSLVGDDEAAPALTSRSIVDIDAGRGTTDDGFDGGETRPRAELLTVLTCGRLRRLPTVRGEAARPSWPESAARELTAGYGRPIHGLRGLNAEV